MGLTGPWSTPAFFTTPFAAGNDYGDWEASCQGKTGFTLSACVWNFVHPYDSMTAFEVTKRVAWLLRSQGGGLLVKGGGENIVPWIGQSFSASRICFSDGHIFKVISDAGPGGANTPAYGDNDFLLPADIPILYVPAIDPRRR